MKYLNRVKDDCEGQTKDKGTLTMFGSVKTSFKHSKSTLMPGSRQSMIQSWVRVETCMRHTKPAKERYE